MSPDWDHSFRHSQGEERDGSAACQTCGMRIGADNIMSSRPIPQNCGAWDHRTYERQGPEASASYNKQWPTERHGACTVSPSPPVPPHMRTPSVVLLRRASPLHAQGVMQTAHTVQ